MIEWLLGPVDPSRPHEVGVAVSWHARSMVVAWAALAPLGVLIARYYKVLPNQDFPKVTNNLFWWRVHLGAQIGALVLSGVGLWLVADVLGPPASVHGWLGYTVLAGLMAQVLLGIFRGSKGGPTEVAKGRPLHGDHYDMTRRRLLFERCHKSIGYATIALALVTILVGLWHANAPRWMWTVLVIWWAGLSAWGSHMQRAGRAVKTYHAIWGIDPCHPGNCMPARPRRMARSRTRINTRESHDIRRH